MGENWGDGAPAGFGPDADGLWRPAPWRGVGTLPGALADLPQRLVLDEEVTLHHDASRAAGRIARPDSAGPSAGAVPAPLHLGIGAAQDMTFVSLVLEVPGAIVAGLGAGHLVLVSARFGAGAAPAGPVHARLNLRLGPRLVQAARPVAISGPEAGHAGFDLGAEGVGAVVPGQAWIDLIFGAPMPQGVIIEDLTVRFRPRAVF